MSLSPVRFAREGYPLRRGLFLALFVFMATQALGCAFGEFRPTDPWDRKWTLEQAQHRYSVLIRWNDIQKAKSFVAEEDRPAFYANMKILKDARFTDFESETVELDKELNKTTVRVTYTLYLPSHPYEIEIVEVQHWSREGRKNNWHVVSEFEGLANFASN